MDIIDKILFLFGFFILAILVRIIEGIISATWNRLYFRSGIKLYQYKVNFINQKHLRDFKTIDIPKLEYEMFEEYYCTIVFKKISSTEIFFRERLIEFNLINYTPIMHGQILLNSSDQNIVVTGRTNISAFFYALMILILSFLFTDISTGEYFGLHVFVTGLIVLILIYYLQVKRYKKIIDYISYCLSSRLL